MKKILISLAAAVIVVIAAAAYFLFSNLDSLVKQAIETIGSQVAGVPVKVDAVKISLTDGKGSLKGLSVGNPSGFQSKNAVTLGEVAISLDTGSVTKNPIVISQITVSAPEVTYELSPNGGSNIQALQNNVQAYGAKSGSGAGDKAAAKPAGDEKKLVIDKLDISKGALTLASPIPGVKGTAPLPDIHLTNLGRDSGGASPAQVAQKVLDALSKSALNAGSSLGIGGQVDAVKNAVGDAAKGVVPQGGSLTKPADALKGLIGK